MRLLDPERPKGAEPGEEHLVRAAVEGNTSAFADLYDRYLDRIYRYFFYRVGHEQDAEDLAEQVFLRAWQAIRGYNHRGTPFGAWLFRIAHNLLVDHYRARRPIGPLDEAVGLADTSPGLEDGVTRRDEAQDLARALTHLSSIEQTVIILRFVEGLDHRTVASIIEKSEVATRTIQSRALVRLGRLLDGQERILE